MWPCHDGWTWGLLGLGLLAAWFCLMNGPAATAAVFSAAALHELGHLLALRLLGGRTAGFTLTIFGGELRAAGLSYPGELAAVLAGPGANLLACAALAAIPAPPDWVCMALGANLALGLFNLLPAAPLDGWRAWALFLCWTLGPDRGVFWSDCVGIAGSALLTGGIVWLMIQSGGNVWLLPAAMGTALGGFRAIRRYGATE